MKKLLTAFLILLLLVIVCAYVFIPKQLTISHSVSAKTNDKWAFKYLMSASEWRKWWPADSGKQQTKVSTLFPYAGLAFKPDSLFYNALTIIIEKNGRDMNSKLFVLPTKKDEVQLTWECNLDGGNNPFNRWQQYRRAVAIKKSMTGILDRYKSWLEVPENIYGFTVTPGKIIDTLLVATRASYHSYPKPEQVDSVFQTLRSYITKNGAVVTGYPMLNVITNEPGIYEAQMALPINKVVPQTDAIRIRRMFAGNALITKIKGGNYTIAKAYEACEHYKADHLRTSPAIPFQSMITDRVAVPDTSKWETIIYYPVH